MSQDADCRFRDDVGPWVLRALAEPDAASFAGHLDGCEACRREVAELQAVADVLPMAVPQVIPPPDLKARVMSVVASEAALLRASGPEADRPPARARPRDGAGRLGWLGRLRPVPAAALATAILAVGVVVGVLATGGGEDVRTIQGTGVSGAQVALSVADGKHGTIEFQHMPAPPSGRVYQVWLVTGNEHPRPTHALFTVPADGRASVDIPESLKDTDQVLVSDEPPGGSRQPTGQVVAGAKLS